MAFSYGVSTASFLLSGLFSLSPLASIGSDLGLWEGSANRSRPILGTFNLQNETVSRNISHAEQSSADKLLTSTPDSNVKFGAPPRPCSKAHVTSVLQREELPGCLSVTALCRCEKSGMCFRSQCEAVVLGSSREENGILPSCLERDSDIISSQSLL